MFGLTFIAMAQNPATLRRWREEERAIKESLDRHRKLMLADRKLLSDDERRLLNEIDEQLSQIAQRRSELKCPECARHFSLISAGEVELDCCRFCRSMWFDPGELQYFSGQAKEIPSDDMAHRKSRFECPVCDVRMNEFVFVNPRTLLVDRCPQGHGVYLEDRELERVFEIV